MLSRWYTAVLKRGLAKPYVHVVFGARQTGKSTLIKALLPPGALVVDLSDPVLRARVAAQPAVLTELCNTQPRGGTVFIDEAQTVPSVFDSVQYLYDQDHERWRFVLCGSSARRLRREGANLLPGRSILHRLFPLTLAEQPPSTPPGAASPLPLVWPEGDACASPFPAWSIEERLAYGSLPGIVTAPADTRADLLRTYAAVHLEEEVRREAYLKDWAAFVRFVQLAAAESGRMVNYASISNQCGLALPTVKSHYQLLEDMFMGFTVQAYTRSARKNILSTPRFFFFDIGVRHAAAGLTPSVDTVRADPGPVFEQWVGAELWRRLQYLGDGRLYYQKTRTGAEVDFVVERGGVLTPIEVKWTDVPTQSDARHVLAFLDEHRGQAPHGYVICRCAMPQQIHERVTALPWSCL